MDLKDGKLSDGYKILSGLDINNLTEEERNKAANVIVESCMGVKAGETVLLVVQREEKRILTAKYHEAEIRRLNAIPIIEYCDDSELKVEPPDKVIAEMMNSDVILAILNIDNTQIFAHTNARVKATAKGARIGLAPLLFPGVEPKDILAIRQRTERLAKIMENAKTARITRS